MGLKGNKFTWSNNRRGNAYFAARLDRALWDSEWHSAFSNPLLAHLPKYSSDHFLLLLSHKQRSSPTNVPSNFKAMWIQHPEFLRIIEQTWNSGHVGIHETSSQGVEQKFFWWNQSQCAKNLINGPKPSGGIRCRSNWPITLWSFSGKSFSANRIDKIQIDGTCIEDPVQI